MNETSLYSKLSQVSLVEVLKNRRTRRFALGMKMEGGPMNFVSAHSPRPLSEEEEAALVFAATGITGYALADLNFAPGAGGNIFNSFLGRTIASGDAIQTVGLVVMNDSGIFYVKRPKEIAYTDFTDLVSLSQKNDWIESYRRCRVKIASERRSIPPAPPYNINTNAWSVNKPGTTYFLPISEYTHLYINGIMEFLNEESGIFIVDERRGFRPAGLSAFAASKGGHLNDDPKAMKTATIERIEGMLTSVAAVEQGMMIQNLSLMAEAMGLGGFPNFAGHEFAWFDALEFRRESLPALKYLGASPWLQRLASFVRKNPEVQYPVGLEKDGEVILKPYCPPYYVSMEAAIRQMLEDKFGPAGSFIAKAPVSYWKNTDAAKVSPPISEKAIRATIAYCDYLYKTYGKFPAYPAPLRTGVAFQAAHLDLDFYRTFYKPEAVSPACRDHMKNFHE